MDLNKHDKQKIGIYCIFNEYNGKVYVGKSKNIYNRIRQHIYYLNRSSKDENRYLINSWNKYGYKNFSYFVLEYLDNFNEKLLSERELFWIEFLQSDNRLYGYNLRKDSSTKMIVHEDTKLLQSLNNSGKNNPNYNHKWSEEKKKLLSDKIKQQFQNGRVIDKRYSIKGVSIKRDLWKKYPDLKSKMIEKVRASNTKYYIDQYFKNGIFIKRWNKINDIILEHPEYKKHNIYSVCNGYKPSIYGFIWKKVIIEDIVLQS